MSKPIRKRRRLVTTQDAPAPGAVRKRTRPKRAETYFKEQGWDPYVDGGKNPWAMTALGLNGGTLGFTELREGKRYVYGMTAEYEIELVGTVKGNEYTAHKILAGKYADAARVRYRSERRVGSF